MGHRIGKVRSLSCSQRGVRVVIGFDFVDHFHHGLVKRLVRERSTRERADDPAKISTPAAAIARN